MNFANWFSSTLPHPGVSTGLNWIESGQAPLFSYSPADGEKIGAVSPATKLEYEKAIQSASTAFETWRMIPAPKRGEIVRQFGDAIRKNKQQLGELVSYEMGKSLQEGLGEVQEMIDICDFAVGLSRQLHGLTMHSERPGHRMYEQYHPLGIIGVISAFNFPVAVWSWNSMLAWVCGDVCVWKPSEKTPLCAVACQKIIAEVLEKNNLPEGISVILNGGREVGEWLAADSRIPLISATGSTRMGKQVAAVVGARLGRTLLELGGNNAIIITAEADLDIAIRGALFGAVGTAGQRCTTTRRLIIQESVYETVKEKLLTAFNQIRIGDPLDSNNLMGPLIDKIAVEQYLNAIEQCKKAGGQFIVDGGVLDGEAYKSGCYVKPCIAEVKHNLPIVHHETFAPILYLIKYQKLKEAIAIQNEVPQGLSSSIMTLNIREAEQFLSAAGSDCGIANVNIGTSGAEIGGAFGGEKETGGGRESGSDAWKIYMRRQTNTINYSKEIPLAQGIKFDLQNVFMKSISISALLFSLAVHQGITAQETPMPALVKEVPKGWHHLDRSSTGFWGISLDKAYSFLKESNKKSKRVIVAVIDSGVDTLHEDLKTVFWKNPGEIANNNKDDDNNGYIDDLYGWNFIGGKNGENVTKDSYEAARVYHRFKEVYDSIDPTLVKFNAEGLARYEMWRRAKQEIVQGSESGAELIMLKRIYANLVKSDSILRKCLGKDTFLGKELALLTVNETDQKKAKNALYSLMSNNDALESTNISFIAELQAYLEGLESKVKVADQAPFPYRASVVKDNYDDIHDKYYGNNNVMVSLETALHGTHISGIIGAVRENGKGGDGVADNVSIMTIRAVPDGDEHDKDIALAIRYAVDNGAQLINMSFGKSFSPEKKWIDEAVAYAAEKDVLLLHAAGNDGKNLDSNYNYPSSLFVNQNRAANWITVGASGDPLTGGIAAGFSNYGKGEVDVFAPGVKIYSTASGSDRYQFLQGTSMASPVVAGLAALLLEYYPTLSAIQIKDVIERSAVPLTDAVRTPGTGTLTTLDQLSKTGGILNAFEAVKLAATIKGERKIIAK